MKALGDVLTLNQLVKDDLRAKAKMIDPPLMAEERAIVGDLNIDPATLSMVRSVNGIKEFPTGGTQSLMASDTAIARLQDAIRSYYLTDRIDFPEAQPQPMTATEAQIRYERLQRHLSATLAHLRNDLLNPIVERTFMMLIRRGQIEPPPEAVMQEGGQLDIEYLGSLTRAQQMDSVASIERTLGAAAGMMEAFPGVRHVIDAKQALRSIATKLNAPADILRDEKEIQKLEKEDQEREKALMDAAQAEAEGSAAEAQGKGQQAMSDA